ncbi:hypothetical protein RAVI111496_23495 [Rahnella victoriana]
MSVIPATARSEKARSPEARALPGLWSVWADAHDLDLNILILKRQRGIPHADAIEERYRAGVLDVISLHGLGQADQEDLLLLLRRGNRSAGRCKK